MSRSKQVAAHVGPTLCRSAASPPHERFVDVIPISLRRDRPLQRLVGRHQSLQVLVCSRWQAASITWPVMEMRSPALVSSCTSTSASTL